MAVAEQEKTNGGGGGATSAALNAAAAAAATGAATYAVKKVRSHDSGGDSSDESNESNEKRESKSKNGKSQGILASAASTSWEAAADALLPMAEDAAEAAGKYVAEHGPEVLRERIIPKFIEAFNDAA